MPNQLLQTLRPAKVKVELFPFTPSDLAVWQWAETHHPEAATAIWKAKNCTYIRDCLAAIRRRMEQVEKADDTLYGFAMQEKWRAERNDRMSQGTSGVKCNGADQRAEELPHASVPKPALDVIPREPQARKNREVANVLFG